MQTLKSDRGTMNTTTNEVFTGLWHENVINWGGGGGANLCPGEIKIWYVWGSLLGGLFLVKKRASFWLVGGGTPSPSTAAGKTLIVLDTLTRSHKRTNA